MGPSGAGKTTVGRLLARRLHLPFCEGDDLHPPANIAKLRNGCPLTDRDRAPWLDRIARWIAAHPAGSVVACSALKRRYRDRLRRSGPLRIVLLDPPAPLLAARLAARTGHFMAASLLPDQLAILERLTAGERAITLSGHASPAALVEAIVTKSASPGAAIAWRAVSSG